MCSFVSHESTYPDDHHTPKWTEIVDILGHDRMQETYYFNIPAPQVLVP